MDFIFKRRLSKIESILYLESFLEMLLDLNNVLNLQDLWASGKISMHILWGNSSSFQSVKLHKIVSTTVKWNCGMYDYKMEFEV